MIPNDHIDHGLTRRIQNTAIDFLVVAAIATICLDVVAKGWIPLLILVAAGIGWNVFCVLMMSTLDIEETGTRRLCGAFLTAGLIGITLFKTATRT